MIWTASHFLFALAMVATFFVRSVSQATAILAVCGICWGVGMWVPFTLLGEYLRVLNTESKTPSPPSPTKIIDKEYALMCSHDSDSDSGLRAWSTDGINPGVKSHSSSSPALLDTHSNGEHPIDAGIALGIHNIYIVFPQFVINVLSSLIFAALHKVGDENLGHGHGGEGSSEAFAWVMRLGGVSAIVAGILSLCVKDKVK